MSIRDVLSNAALFALHASRTRAPSARKSNDILCQNCQIPSEPWPNTVIYGDTPIHILMRKIVDGWTSTIKNTGLKMPASSR